MLPKPPCIVIINCLQLISKKRYRWNKVVRWQPRITKNETLMMGANLTHKTYDKLDFWSKILQYTPLLFRTFHFFGVTNGSFLWYHSILWQQMWLLWFCMTFASVLENTSHGINIKQKKSNFHYNLDLFYEISPYAFQQEQSRLLHLLHQSPSLALLTSK